jgi:hypothetical protein
LTTTSDPDDEFVARVAAAINALDIDVHVNEGTGGVRADFPRYRRLREEREASEAAQKERERLFDEWHAGPDGAPWPL